MPIGGTAGRVALLSVCVPVLAISASAQSQRMSWQLGSFGDGPAEFESITRPEVVYRVNARSSTKAALRQRLSATECRKLTLEFALGRGAFEFRLGFEEPRDSAVVWPQVFFDDRELSTWFAAPLARAGLLPGKSKSGYQVLRYPLVSER